jgi:hypothetical protein
MPEREVTGPTERNQIPWVKFQLWPLRKRLDVMDLDVVASRADRTPGMQLEVRGPYRAPRSRPGSGRRDRLGVYREVSRVVAGGDSDGEAQGRE